MAMEFRISRSTLSLLTSRLSRAISCCSGFIWPWPRKGLHRIGAELLHPFAQNILMNVQVSGADAPRSLTS
jgi:hypothetical protein